MPLERKATQAAEAAAQAAASTVAEQLVELSKLRQHYVAEVVAVNNLEWEAAMRGRGSCGESSRSLAWSALIA
jgi:hypothetical protein